MEIGNKDSPTNTQTLNNTDPDGDRTRKLRDGDSKKTGVQATQSRWSSKNECKCLENSPIEQ